MSKFPSGSELITVYLSDSSLKGITAVTSWPLLKIKWKKNISNHYAQTIFHLDFILFLTYLVNSSNSGVKQIFIDFEANGLQNNIFPALTLGLIPIMLNKQNIKANFILIFISICICLHSAKIGYCVFCAYTIYSMNPSICDIRTENRYS